MIRWLDQYRYEFPPLEEALTQPNGLLAAGGDLSPERLLAAYRHGVFPWYEEGQPILWWSPDPRAVLFPDRFHEGRSLSKARRRNQFHFSVDTAFSQVIRRCAGKRPRQSGTWITADMQQAYCELHALGHAHSVECWQHNELVGGLYGIAIGRVFFGESMFSLRPDASKLALAYLVNGLRAWNFALIDCQQESMHLSRLGAESVTRSLFQAIVLRESALPGYIGSWRTTWSELAGGDSRT